MIDVPQLAVDDGSTRALRSAREQDTSRAEASAPRLPGYELGEQIGAGGMGTVYKADHLWLGRTVAVKFMTPAIVGDSEALTRFGNEVRAIGRLDHPNIVRATDAGRVGGIPYLVTEFSAGQDLGRLVKRRGPLRVAEACELIRQAALGLQHAHEQGLIHRDIKPANMILDGRGVLKLLDFGLARIVAAETSLTSTGQMLGTLDYLAPEQAGDARLVDIRSDLYSLGCTFHFLLAGTPPFSGIGYESPASKIKGHLADSPPLLAAGRLRIPQAVLAIVERLLAKSPNDRYRTPAEVAAALAPHARGAKLLPLLPAELRCETSTLASQAPRGASPDWVDEWFDVLLAVPRFIGWTFRRLFGRRKTTTGGKPRESFFSISGVLMFAVLIYLFSHMSCVPHGKGPRLEPGDPDVPQGYMFRVEESSSGS